VPEPPAAVEQAPLEPDWPEELDDSPADRAVLVFWGITFTLLALIMLCDLLVVLFR
jgi:hypothetical protein